MTIKIYIPTFRRVDFQITFASLPDKYKEKAILVVQEQEQHLQSSLASKGKYG